MGKSSTHSSRRRVRGIGWVTFSLSPWVSFDLSGIFLFDSGEASFPGGIFSESFSHQPDHPKPTLRSRYSPKDILSHRSSVKKEGGITWKQSIFKIQLPRSLSFPTIEENFRRSFSNLGKDFSLQLLPGIRLSPTRSKGDGPDYPPAYFHLRKTFSTLNQVFGLRSPL